MRGTRVLASIATAVVGLGTLGLLAATTIPVVASAPQLPPDGLVTQAAWEQGGQVQVEQSLAPAAALGGALGAAVAGGVAPETTALRVTFAPSRPHDVVMLLVDGDDLVLHGFSLDDDGRYFEDGIPLVDGTTVSGTAHVAAVSSAPFEASVAVVAAPSGCDDVTIDAVVADATESIALTLCEGRGLTAFRVETAQRPASGFAVDGAPVPFGETTLEVPARDWRDAAEWEPVVAEPRVADAFGSVTGRSAAAGLAGSPAALLDGGVAVVDAIADDVAVFDRGSDGIAELRWRGHPGGQVASVVTVGDLVVAVRTGGSMVAYSVDGVRVWESDVATESIVGGVLAATGHLSFATTDGVVRLLDAATGELVWERQVAERLTAGVVGDERVIIAVDREGNLAGFTYDGAQPLYGAVPSAFDVVAIDVDHTYLGRSNVLESYSIWDSTFLWATDLPGRVTATCSTGDVAVVAATGGTVALDPQTGTIVRAEADSADALVCGDGAVAVALGASVELWPTSGDDRSLQMSGPVVALDASGLAPAADGLWVVEPEAFVWWGR